MTTEDEVHKVSEQFYAALNSMVNGDTGPMENVWSHTADVTAMHPIGSRQIGWDEVRESFAQVSGLSSEGQVKLADQIVRVAGEMAYELGVEKGQALLAGQQVIFDQRVTNIYRRGPGGWKIVHHHTDISPAMLELLRGLQAGA